MSERCGGGGSLFAPLGPPPVLRQSLALHVSVRQPAVQGGAAALASDPIAYWVRGGRASLALLAFAVSVAGAQCAVARRRGAFVLQRRSLVGLLDAATCRKSPLSCSSSCYAALFCLESLMPLKSCGVSEDPICREGVALRTRVDVPSRTGVPNFKSMRELQPVFVAFLSAASRGV